MLGWVFEGSSGHLGWRFVQLQSDLFHGKAFHAEDDQESPN